jgi:hypothetical protein
MYFLFSVTKYYSSLFCRTFDANLIRMDLYVKAFSFVSVRHVDLTCFLIVFGFIIWISYVI